MMNQEQNHGIPVKNVGVKRVKFTLYKNTCKKCASRFVSKNKQGKYCSRTCYWEDKKGKKNWWGYKIGDKLRGIPKSPEHIKNAHEAWDKVEKKWQIGEKHHLWKGDNVSYTALHDWVRKYKGTPKKCESCGLDDEKRMYHWANISGLYLRKLEDWVRLCVSCHRKFDYSKKNDTINT